MGDNRKVIRSILLEQSSIFILLIAFFSMAILLNPKGEVNPSFASKHSMAVMVQNIAPYVILIESKAILDILLDFIFRFSTIEKIITALFISKQWSFLLYRACLRNYTYLRGNLVR